MAEAPAAEEILAPGPERSRSSGEFGELAKAASAQVLAPGSADEDSGSDAWDFESITSASSSGSEVEIPEAIQEGSTSGGEYSEDSDDDVFVSMDSPRPTVINNWITPAISPRPTTPAFSGETTSTLGGPARTPVRRARVRGPICLTTSKREYLPVQPATPGQARRQDGNEPRPEAECSALLPTGALADVRERLEAEREVAARRALASEAALVEERANHEAELAKQAHEAADRQAILQAVNHDRTELATLYREAHQELSRLRAELSQRTVELLELTQSQEKMRKELQTRPRQSTCVVCLNAEAVMAAVPCGHLVFCEACLIELVGLPCPVCRQPCEYSIHIFTP